MLWPLRMEVVTGSRQSGVWHYPSKALARASQCVESSHIPQLIQGL